MKDAKEYEARIKTLLRKKPKRVASARPEDPYDIAALVRAVLESDASRQQAEKALEAIRHEYVDFNELRVSPLKDLVECIGRDYPQARDKAQMITGALQGIFSRTYRLSLEYMAEMTKRNLRRHLKELGLNEYAEAALTLEVFGGHAIPVDQLLVDCLAMDGYVHPESDLPDVQGFLERVISQKDALAAHEFFRKYVQRREKVLLRRRQAEAAKAQAAEAEAAKAQAEKKAAEARAKKRASAKKTKKKVKASAKAAGRASGKKAAGKVAGTSKKRAVKKAAKKRAKKAAKSKKASRS